ncbi:rRNA adenine N-6-methyltransferase family protein [Puerhibacterium puerhi]|uniref:rRNA adenine N-6-methyltransferase family protein n=1 Tax=Puerhibacterium puerhi TaxID=2692623 RepID=UPI0013589FF5|nr:rRNA adenine N-6-methyltransferase family protein [Puerhibacterium puerhi]
MPGNGSRRAWGWHPLRADFARAVVADAGVLPGELVLDLGAGTGALTHHLVAAGARVVAVELHPGRAQALRERFAGADVRVVAVDLAAVRWPRRPFRVVASPPYGHTTALVRALLDRRTALVRADLVLQRQAARRLAERYAGAPRWHVEVARALPRRAFSPPPRVDSAVLVVRRR